MSRGNWWRCAKCRTCRKEIIVREGYAYKIPNGKWFMWFCSWRCLQAYRNGKTRKTKKQGLREGETVE